MGVVYVDHISWGSTLRIKDMVLKAWGLIVLRQVRGGETCICEGPCTVHGSSGLSE